MTVSDCHEIFTLNFWELFLDFSFKLFFMFREYSYAVYHHLSFISDCL